MKTRLKTMRQLERFRTQVAFSFIVSWWAGIIYYWISCFGHCLDETKTTPRLRCTKTNIHIFTELDDIRSGHYTFLQWNSKGSWPLMTWVDLNSNVSTNIWHWVMKITWNMRLATREKNRVSMGMDEEPCRLWRQWKSIFRRNPYWQPKIITNDTQMSIVHDNISTPWEE